MPPRSNRRSASSSPECSVGISATAVEMVRGILVTIHASLADPALTREGCLAGPPRRIRRQAVRPDRQADPGALPVSRAEDPRGNELLRDRIREGSARDRLVILGAIDNLVKGTSGNARPVHEPDVRLARDPGARISGPPPGVTMNETTRILKNFKGVIDSTLREGFQFSRANFSPGRSEGDLRLPRRGSASITSRSGIPAKPEIRDMIAALDPAPARPADRRILCHIRNHTGRRRAGPSTAAPTGSTSSAPSTPSGWPAWA